MSGGGGAPSLGVVRRQPTAASARGKNHGDCNLVVDRDLAVSATFESKPPPPPNAVVLTVKKNGSGTVRSNPAGLDCGSACAASFSAGTRVSLAAQPDAGSRFAGWSDGCGGSGDCDLEMSADMAVTANFVRQYRLSLTISGAGSGAVSIAPDGRTCTASCDARIWSCRRTATS